MGCYGIGVSRLVATTIEQHHDDNGIRWPMSLAPYHVHLVTIGKDEGVVAAGAPSTTRSGHAGVEVLWDDRDERPGVKFKDADLIGIPLRVTIGAKGLAAGHVELKARTEADPKKAELVPFGPTRGRAAPRRARPRGRRRSDRQRRRAGRGLNGSVSRATNEGVAPHRSSTRTSSRARAVACRRVTGEVEVRVAGRAGGPTIAARIHAPSGVERAVVICHPHPLYGGSMHSPVPLALAKVLSDEVRDRVAWARFDFRGVGGSEGTYDDGRGEVDDALAVMDAAAPLRPRRTLVGVRPLLRVVGRPAGGHGSRRRGSRRRRRPRPAPRAERASSSPETAARCVVPRGRPSSSGIATSSATWTRRAPWPTSWGRICACSRASTTTS